LLDTSVAMLELAERAAQEAGVANRVVLKEGNAEQLAEVLPVASFDVILCHNLLEYVDDPVIALRGAARALRDPSSIVSVLVRNHAGEVLKAAIQGGDLAATEQTLNAEWGHESLYGGRVRLFTADNLRDTLKAASLTAIAERGVRVISDYLPPQVSRSAEYDRILEVEQNLSRRPEFARVARYMQWLARRSAPVIEE